jgi:hypothetical protein
LATIRGGLYDDRVAAPSALNQGVRKMAKFEHMLTEEDLRKIIAKHIRDTVNVSLSPDSVNIQAKPKQNYRSEWETAEFRAIVSQKLP